MIASDVVHARVDPDVMETHEHQKVDLVGFGKGHRPAGGSHPGVALDGLEHSEVPRIEEGLDNRAAQLFDGRLGRCFRAVVDRRDDDRRELGSRYQLTLMGNTKKSQRRPRCSPSITCFS